MVSPRAKRSGVEGLMERGLSQRRACRLIGLDRSSARYKRRLRADETATVALIREYAHEQPMYGYRIIAAMLKHDGYRINRKRVYRIWRQEGLQLPRRRVIKRRYGNSSGTLRRATKPNEVWTYDFLEGRTERGGKLRMLTVLDEYTRECLTIQAARSMSSRQVIKVLEWLFLVRGRPDNLRSDNGPEFIAYAIQQWLRDRHCYTLYITPGSPWENPFIESFNGTFRADCLDRWVFADGREAQDIIEQWRLEYNHRRPHSSLGYLTPADFAEQVAAAQQPPATQPSLSL
jgi:putative transposase